MEVSGNCLCGQPLPLRHRKFCKRCSSQASLLWKRRQRSACRGSTYWLDHWLKLTGDPEAARQAYNAYMCEYMRGYRLRQREGRSPSEATADATGRRVPARHLH